MPMETLEDDRLSWRSRGVLIGLLGKPDGWDVRADAIARAGKEGREAILAALNELGEFGYYTIAWRQATAEDVAAEIAKRRGVYLTETWVSDTPVQEWVESWPAVVAWKKVRGTPKEFRTEKWAKDIGLDKVPEVGSLVHLVGSTDVGKPDVGQPGVGQPNAGSPDALSSSSLTVPANAGTNTQGDARATRGAQPKGTRIDPNWEPDEELKQWTRAEIVGTDVNPWREVQQFRDHWTATSGQRASKRDWRAAWRTWIRKSVQDAGRPGVGHTARRSNPNPYLEELREAGTLHEMFPWMADDQQQPRQVAP